MKRFYLLAAVVGTIIPWYFFASFFATEGFNLPLFLSGLFVNGSAGGFSADVLISIGGVLGVVLPRRSATRKSSVVAGAACFVFRWAVACAAVVPLPARNGVNEALHFYNVLRSVVSVSMNQNAR